MPMPGRWTPFLADARHHQIAALTALLAVNFLVVDFGARPLASALAIGAALATQAACAWWFGLPRLDLRSPLITGLSLSLLLRADAASIHAVAGVIAILSKFVLRVGDKHVFNPAGFAIVALGKPRKRCPSDGDRGFESTSLQRRVEREPDLAPWNRSPRPVPWPVFRRHALDPADVW